MGSDLYFLDYALECLIEKRVKNWGYFQVSEISSFEYRLTIGELTLRLSFPKSKKTHIYRAFWGREIQPAIHTSKRNISEAEDKFIVTINYRREDPKMVSRICMFVINPKLATLLEQKIIVVQKEVEDKKNSSGDKLVDAYNRYQRSKNPSFFTEISGYY